MSQKDQSLNNLVKNKVFLIYFFVEIALIIFSIIIPHNLIILNHRLYGCSHHSSGIDGYLWEWGRALGFTTLIWFVVSSIQGFTINKHAKLFHKKKRARDLHCLSSFICILFMILHLILLFNYEPWRSIILRADRAHFSFNTFQLKIQNGIIVGLVMAIVSFLSLFARNPKVMKKIGYKRFKIIHWMMIIVSFVLILHVLYINTEIWIMTGDRLR
jgi:predicted ferric reductase